ncbi:hypothetical protein VKT23_015864 [Stygiomarasmius scandens]|uniref:Glucose receptor Git3 N-terminal domain-containing protein n=1 Tax=Marasmiellus scandens TaxID=2682957 RepID=A0ABR1IWQ6_9AGAR
MVMVNSRQAVGNGMMMYDYGKGERAGVIVLVVAGLLSITAVLYLILVKTPRPSTYRRTHLFGYLLSMLLANLLQSTGTVMNLRWIMENRVILDLFCTYQGAIKQAGNVSTAVWSFAIAVHLFNMLFLRSKFTQIGFWITLILGWGLVVTVVLIGPAALEHLDRGPYFGISGPWCWITEKYPKERILLEYFLEFLSAVVSIILYTFIILRVRGNMFKSDGRWHLRFVPREESWKLSFERDLIDSCMLKVSQSMVWFPVAYTIILIPITITRFSGFSGAEIPFGATIFGALIFNLTGFVNVVLLLITKRLFPDMDTIPELSTQRSKHLSVFQRGGITPFTLTRSDTAERYERERQATASIRQTGTSSNRSSVCATTDIGDMNRNSLVSISSGQSQLGLISENESKSPVYYLSFTKETI